MTCYISPSPQDLCLDSFYMLSQAVSIYP
jgi:hypothetical protein